MEKKKKYTKPEVVRIPVDFKQLVKNSTGGSCPFILVWNGYEYVIENTILPVSLDFSRKEKVVCDYYVLQNVPHPENGQIKLKISELEHEISWLQQLELLVVEHLKEYRIGFSPENKLLSYLNPQAIPNLAM
jgi:hypothetical protein